jgi:sugar/nucleoside kinase (ribokinase family)
MLFPIPSALAIAVLESMPLHEAAWFASAVAAMTTMSFGAHEAVPSRAAVEAFLRDFGG